MWPQLRYTNNEHVYTLHYTVQYSLFALSHFEHKTVPLSPWTLHGKKTDIGGFNEGILHNFVSCKHSPFSHFAVQSCVG